MTKSELQSKIIAAFSHVPYPGDDRLGDPNSRDDGEAVTEYFLGQDWRSQNSSELWDGALYSMTPEAYQYFFPAYLLAAMEKDSGDVAHALICRITPPSESEAGFDNFLERHSLFTTAQKDVVKDYLTWEIDKLIAYRTKKRFPRTGEEKDLETLRDYWSNL